jgi:hypothetical protein
MRPAKPFLLGYWVILAIVCAKLLLLIYFFAMQYFSGSRVMPLSIAFGYGTLVAFFILIAEMIIYRNLRYRIVRKSWVHIHVWTLLVVVLVVPVASSMAMDAAMQSQMDDTEYFHNSLFDTIRAVTFYTYWTLIIIGHIFFIATIVKSLQLKKTETDEAPGILDEFTNRP